MSGYTLEDAFYIKARRFRWNTLWTNCISRAYFNDTPRIKSVTFYYVLCKDGSDKDELPGRQCFRKWFCLVEWTLSSEPPKGSSGLSERCKLFIKNLGFEPGSTLTIHCLLVLSWCYRCGLHSSVSFLIRQGLRQRVQFVLNTFYLN